MINNIHKGFIIIAALITTPILFLFALISGNKILAMSIAIPAIAILLFYKMNNLYAQKKVMDQIPDSLKENFMDGSGIDQISFSFKSENDDDEDKDDENVRGYQ